MSRRPPSGYNPTKQRDNQEATGASTSQTRWRGAQSPEQLAHWGHESARQKGLDERFKYMESAKRTAPRALTGEEWQGYEACLNQLRTMDSGSEYDEIERRLFSYEVDIETASSESSSIAHTIT